MSISLEQLKEWMQTPEENEHLEFKEEGLAPKAY